MSSRFLSLSRGATVLARSAVRGANLSSCPVGWKNRSLAALSTATHKQLLMSGTTERCWLSDASNTLLGVSGSVQAGAIEARQNRMDRILLSVQGGLLIDDC